MENTSILQLVILGLTLIACAIAAWFARRSAVRDLRGDVDDLISAVDKIGRITRREQMKRVREAADEFKTPPGLQPSPGPAPVLNVKAELRRKAFGG